MLLPAESAAPSHLSPPKNTSTGTFTGSQPLPHREARQQATPPSVAAQPSGSKFA